MVLNVSQRVIGNSAVVLGVRPDATPEEVLAALTAKVGTIEGREPSSWLKSEPRDLPRDPRTARVVAAARVMISEPRVRSHAVVAFLAADARLPEVERKFPPTPESPDSGQQLSLLA